MPRFDTTSSRAFGEHLQGLLPASLALMSHYIDQSNAYCYLIMNYRGTRILSSIPCYMLIGPELKGSAREVIKASLLYCLDAKGNLISMADDNVITAKVDRVPPDMIESIYNDRRN